MESTTSLAKKLLGANFATPSGEAISLQQGGGFYWEPKSTTVFYDSLQKDGPQLLLHELGHALLGHGTYDKDIELIAMERAAWERALALGSQYRVGIPADMIEDYLDSYRDWLHARSLCPTCGDTGLQTGPKTYQCLSCGGTWRVNEARTCNLRRYKVK